MTNQNPEQLARDAIDRMLLAAGWGEKSINSSNGIVKNCFDVFQVGLTATPDNRTFGCFNKNVVSNYGYEKP